MFDIKKHFKIIFNSQQYWKKKTKFLVKFMHIVNFNYPTTVIQYIKMITMPEVEFIYQ
jgi:hypothetical protein